MVRSIWRTVDPALLRNVSPIALTAFVTGASFGAIAVAAHIPVALVCAMSLLIFAGGSQFMVVGIVAAGGSPIAAVLAGLLLNARHLPFGLAIGDVLGDRLGRRIVGTHILIDESVAFAMAQRSTGQGDRARARAAFWTCGLALFLTWNAGTLVGALIGQVIGDPSRFGMDAAFPAAMFALILPALKDRRTLRVAVLGAAIAVATTPFLPPGIPVVLAAFGVLAALPTGKKAVAA
ncbi:AzlC family ABC transporter permease [Kutzneria buriramensis]|uniref:4-azaleucine resistance transporter AzlC n=1 Tax=Kutzneria buriramensis TaxID=1045776 RepID=A0A3E0HFP7_9PSEU|nr:AzlC family ABC transporter permease [Kutzneria buriramensis]REH44625.1 4-azaleucine resistance transporter AzlC [Kutzneria buriramensis]